MKYNATADSDSIICVFPISGQYAIMTRALLHVTLVVGIFAAQRRLIWITIAAWAYIMTSSTAAAIHLWLVLGMRKMGFFNLDFAGSWAILSASLLVGNFVAMFSGRLAKSPYRPTFDIWRLVLSCTCCALLIVFIRSDEHEDYQLEPACWSNSTGENLMLLTSRSQLLVPDRFKCTYKCFDRSYPLRDQNEITVVTAQRAFGKHYKLLHRTIWATIILSLMAFAMGAVSMRRRTQEELECTINAPTPFFESAEERRTYQQLVKLAREELRTGKPQPPSGALPALCGLVALPVVIACNEVYMMASEPLPVGEAAYAVGQWAPWVCLTVTLIAAGCNTKYEPRWLELRTRWDEHDRKLGRNESSKSDKTSWKDTEPDQSQPSTEASDALQRPPEAHLDSNLTASNKSSTESGH